MKNKLLALYNKHGDILRYLIVGGLTTAINIVSFWILTTPIEMHYNIANVLAQILAITFAFFGNKWFVFRTKTEGWKSFAREALRFATSRAIVLLFSVGFMRIVVGSFGLDENLGNLLNNVMMIIFNYVLSRLMVFRR